MKSARIVVIGASLGGLTALEKVLSVLPRSFGLPIVVVQHRSHDSPELLAKLLQAHTLLPVTEPNDKDPIEPGHVYLAPADYHLLVDTDGFHLSTEAPVRHSRPSIDILFESAADAFGFNVIAVVLTGANPDGTEGTVKIKERGGLVVVQNPRTAEAKAMPESVVHAIQPDHVLELAEVGPFLVRIDRGDGSI